MQGRARQVARTRAANEVNVRTLTEQIGIVRFAEVVLQETKANTSQDATVAPCNFASHLRVRITCSWPFPNRDHGSPSPSSNSDNSI
jgi:hypothetical protein